MSHDSNIVWADCLRTIRAEVGEQSFRTWFERIVPVALHDNVLTVQVPTIFYHEFLEEEYAEELKRAIGQHLGSDGHLAYSVVSDVQDDWR